MAMTQGPFATERAAATRRFLRDMLVAAAGVSVVPYLVFKVLVAAPMGAMLLLLLVYFVKWQVWLLYYIAPGLVLLYGIIRGRPGIIAGPIVVVGGFYLWSSGVKWQQAAAVHAFAPATIKAPSRAHLMLAIEGPTLPGEKTEAGAGCEAVCMRILATTSYVLAKKQDSPSWSVYRRGTGDDCRAGDGVASALDFLSAGYVGMCAIQSTETSIDEGLVYKAEKFRAPPAHLPVLENGWVLEAIERIDGQDAVLGRRFIGERVVSPVLPLAYPTDRVGEHFESGPELDRREFIAWALRVPVEELPNSKSPARPKAFDPASLPTLLDAVESYLDEPTVARKAAGTWANIAGSLFDKREPGLFRERVGRLLASDKPGRVAAALGALASVPQEQRDFAAARVVEIAFGPMLAIPDSPVAEAMERHLGSWSPVRSDGGRGPFAPEIRARARARFVSDAPLTVAQRQIFFRILSCDGWRVRHDGMDALFSIRGRTFPDAVAAIANARPPTFSGYWASEDQDRLIERLKEIPASGLESYIAGFTRNPFNRLSDEQRERLVQHLRERLNAAEAAPSRDEPQVLALNRLIAQYSSRRR